MELIHRRCAGMDRDVRWCRWTRRCRPELIKPRGPWRTVEQVEVATLEWVDWFNHRRLYEHNSDIPPVELEKAYYAQNRAQQPAGLSNQ